MHRCRVLVLSVLALLASAAAQPASTRLLLKDGTPVRLRLANNVSSADAKSGDQVEFEALEEIRVADLVVVPKGGAAFGTVTEAQPKKLIGGGGKLNVSIDHVQLASGDKAALRPIRESRRAGQSGQVTTANGNAGPFDSVVNFVYGKDVTIPKGTEITAYVNGDFEILRAKFLPSVPAAAAAEPAAPALTENATTSVVVSSTPPGADIELDGAFVGSTPSIIGMALGDHTITIRKKSFRLWERKIKATQGNIKIEAELEPQK